VRAAAVVAGAGLLLLAAPGVASADVIFDPADADELATVLAEATTDQEVCYGWDVQVDDAVAGRAESVGSNFGAGQTVSAGGTCPASVELKVYITYTSESSESEDSASYDVVSTSGGPTRDDMAALNLETDTLAGENPDVVIGKMVAALPLLAADKGIAKGIEATPQTGEAPADAALTDSPGSDWWRNNGGMLLWGVGLLLAGGIFAWWVVRSNRRYKPARDVSRVPSYVPDTVPAEFYDQDPTTPVPTQGAPDAEPTQPVTRDTIAKAAADKAALEKRAGTGTPAAESTPDEKPDAATEQPEPSDTTESPSEGARSSAASTTPSAESAEPSSDQATAPESESAADRKNKE
jgi:hypothetical protein